MTATSSASSSTDASRAELIRLQRLRVAQDRLVVAVQQLSLARSLPAIQDVVRHAAREIAAADGATFVLRDGERCYYADEDAIAPLWKGQRFPLSACISGWAMLHATAAVIPDIYADERVPIDAYRPTFVRSLVMVPIRLSSPIGAIGVYWSQPHQASREELDLLQALANTTSVAMENVEVYRSLEERVADRTRQLQVANDELESFSYSVSHDLRGPLRTVSGFADLLLERLETSGDDELKGFARRIRTGADRMSLLIEDLLKLARIGRATLHRTEFDLGSVCHDIIAQLQSETARPPVTVDVGTPLPIRADRRLMTIVMQNLLANAWKYTAKNPGAKISIGMTTTPERAYFVRDNGVGFDPRFADGLFKPFSRLHPDSEFQGTGVGLATVKRIIARHGGRIWAEAEVGVGATFYFTCPEANDPTPAA
jgi:signal transduction histidine kinase